MYLASKSNILNPKNRKKFHSSFSSSFATYNLSYRAIKIFINLTANSPPNLSALPSNGSLLNPSLKLGPLGVGQLSGSNSAIIDYIVNVFGRRRWPRTELKHGAVTAARTCPRGGRSAR